MNRLTSLRAGQVIVHGGDRFSVVSPELAAAFVDGDRLVVVHDDGALLRIPAAEHRIVDATVTTAIGAFSALAAVSDAQITEFFDHFAARLADDESFAPIALANADDVESARAADRFTTRLELTAAMRADMISGLHVWRDSDPSRDHVVSTVVHAGWTLESRRAPLGVVGFVFEGRPNVFADACGVLRTGNAVVFRIGSDALGTARAIVEHALGPAVTASGLPAGVVGLVDSPERSAGHALFSDPRVALAVARGSGAAVAQLGAVARQAGIPVSLHGTGGAWIIVGAHADAADVGFAIEYSLDRKVCNTLNCLVVVRDCATEVVPGALDALQRAARRRGAEPRLHVVEGSESYVPSGWPDATARVVHGDARGGGPIVDVIEQTALAVEWEWENSPEITLLVVDGIDDAVDAFNLHSPRFVASLISSDDHEHERFYAAVDAPFVGNGFTRWVDGQYALDRPELGLSNWQGGRMLGRGAILSGDGVHTIRYRAEVTDTSTHR